VATLSESPTQAALEWATTLQSAMQLCAITDRLSLGFPGQLLTLAEAWAAGGVEFIQLREKDLPNTDLQLLAEQIKQAITGTPARLLINIASPDSPLAGIADGVHLAGNPQPGFAATVRRNHPRALVSVPCHSLEDVQLAVAEQVDLLLFSPVFEKGTATPQGLEALQSACAVARPIPVFALGGVTTTNAAACVAAGAAGVAGIRLFAGSDWRRLHDI
jgi:thiamine-phosphate pyrophosphorylase